MIIIQKNDFFFTKVLLHALDGTLLNLRQFALLLAYDKYTSIRTTAGRPVSRSYESEYFCFFIKFIIPG